MGSQLILTSVAWGAPSGARLLLLPVKVATPVTSTVISPMHRGLSFSCPVPLPARQHREEASRLRRILQSGENEPCSPKSNAQVIFCCPSSSLFELWSNSFA